MNFFKHFLASVLGTVVAFIIIGVLLFVGIASMATLITAEEMQVAEIKSESILRLDLDQPIYDNIPAAQELEVALGLNEETYKFCLLYTSPSPRDLSTSRMPSSA